MNYGSEENDHHDVTPEDVKRFLQSALSPEDFQRVEEMLTALCNQAENEENQEPDDQENDFVAPGKAGFIGEFGDPAGYQEDEPPPFKGRPRPGGAQDGMRAYGAHLWRAEADYARRWPEAKRIQHAFDAGGSPRPAKVSSAVYADYARRWGNTRVL